MSFGGSLSYKIVGTESSYILLYFEQPQCNKHKIKVVKAWMFLRSAHSCIALNKETHKIDSWLVKSLGNKIET